MHLYLCGVARWSGKRCGESRFPDELCVERTLSLLVIRCWTLYDGLIVGASAACPALAMSVLRSLCFASACPFLLASVLLWVGVVLSPL